MTGDDDLMDVSRETFAVCYSEDVAISTAFLLVSRETSVLNTFQHFQHKMNAIMSDITL